MVTANVFKRVVQIRCGGEMGTGFTLEYNGSQYLVTAAHVVKSGQGPRVSVQGTERPVTLRRLPAKVPGVDVAVFSLSQPITPQNLPLPATRDGMVFGQEVYFLGFPMVFNHLVLHFDLENGEHLALPKSATLSGSMRMGSRKVLLLDGLGNPGFSGGPVVFRPLGAQKRFQICGIVTGRNLEPAQEPNSKYPSSSSQPFVDSRVLTNSGIVIAEEIERALEIISGSGISIANPSI